ncbi:dicarboxylate/amino acid:cation symporter [Leptotrichia sp. OH3620_COT-345]|uniref:dicarboxylate/amino acid:cation symporter n=1 Tax=Leptotrichia sp. OH3620_COT-345 TaxID=2491048 RepID=UPI000F648C79|nr:dicarboxylate/amino acid:cation symporter [Leptotrichia sp. OH3620_COT-345]RRD39706.1 dicarboxylate/amino acid:cation symporter [Leptotrichia sp. OH3620_COT-345]
MLKKIPLLLQIVIAIILGILLGKFASKDLMITKVFSINLVRILITFSDIFGQLLKFLIPLIILAFIAPGIGALAKGAGKLLGITTGFAYGSTIISGMTAFITASILYPIILKGQSVANFANPEEALLKGYFIIDIPAPMAVMTALVLAFVLGLGMSVLKTNHLFNVMDEFKTIIEGMLEKIIVPLLPFYILGVFANMTAAGQITGIISVFIKVFIMILILHASILIFQYTIAGIMTKQNSFKMLKTMMPAYFTALGTQSSASTIPVTLKSAKKMGIREEVVNFAIPLCATIHLSGSTITLVSCSTAVFFMQHGMLPGWGLMIKFILLLGVTMVAAPGVPGGAVVAALGILSSVLGFDETMLSLMIALYIAQDSLGTACNVTGDGAIAAVTSVFVKDDE